VTVDSARWLRTYSKAQSLAGHSRLAGGELQGWLSLYDVIRRSGTYFLSMYRLLVALEGLMEPRAQSVTSSFGPPLGVVTIPPEDRRVERLKKDLEEFLPDDAKDLGLNRTESRLNRINSYIKRNESRLATSLDFVGDAELQVEIRVLREALMDDLDERWIFFPNLEKFQNYALLLRDRFSQDLRAAFPDAERDIYDAAQCYVTDNNTASVFHSMRVAEYGLRALAKRVNPRLRPEKLEWGAIIRELRKKIDELHQPGKKKLTPRREERLDFYSEALDQCVYFKTVRDSTMHARAHHESTDALKAPTHIEDFMKLLTKNGIKLIPKIGG
jgi:ribosomal protein S15P/S13E